MALPYSVPDVLIDNTQVGNVLDDPIAFRVRAGDALSRIRVFDIAQSVPDELADIKLVVEDAAAALWVAVNGGRPPVAALRSGYALAVQRHGDGPRRLTFQVVREDAAHDIRFGLVDCALAATGFSGLIELAYNIIAVAKPTARLAIFDPAAQAAPRLVGKVFDVKRAHRALKADMQFAHFAFRERDDADAGEAHPLVEAGNVFLIAGKSVERFRQDHVKAAL
ncbi:hypothetical protein BG46_17595 [Brucella anthropi]|nr:hypothetical protein BG46_17595 [Brucella anthropi]